jgi:hypothetical protein
MFRTISLSFVSILAFAACTSNQQQLDPNEVDDTAADAKADGFTPMRLGTYDVSFVDYYAMTLHDDGTFHLQGGCRPNPDGANCFAISVMDGNYRFTHSGSSHYIRLYNNIDGSLAFRFRYVVSGAHSETVDLVETKDGSDSTATLEEADKRQEGENCGGFVATPGQCATGLECVSAQACCDLPGTCQPASN